MRLDVICKECQKNVAVEATAADRVQLSMKIGKHFPLECKSCGHKDTYHVNDVYAGGMDWSSFALALVIGGLFVFLIAVGLQSYMIMVVSPPAVIAAYITSRSKKMRAFNRHTM